MTLPHGLKDISFARPQAFYLLIPAAAIFAWMLLQADSWRKLFAPAMRALLLALIVFALAGPQRVAEQEGSARAVLVDLSRSMTPAMREWTSSLLLKQLKFRRSDPAIVFGLHPVRTTVGQLAEWQDKPCADCAPEGTDLEVPLKEAANDSSGGPVVMVTDGWENHGDGNRAASALLGSQSQLYVFAPPTSGSVPNVAVTHLSLPRALPNAEPFALGVSILNMNEAPAKGTIKIFENDHLADKRDVTL